ncbi:MAG TPA: formate dehydrogenase accessory protein FdhE [Gemmatimonadaceae bacterium]|nr:formate dehydrogenase accessory protein FdhE [Gemmatimonadaceae bacterium]
MTSPRPSVTSQSLANQLEPIVRVHADIRARRYARVDVATARTRILAGRAGIDFESTLSGAPDLSLAFSQVASAFERTGITATPQINALQAMTVDADAHVLAWANHDSPPSDVTMKLARNLAGIVGNAILSQVAAEIMNEFSPTGWKWPECPCCRASPDLAMTADAGRILVCWRCDTRWSTELRGCLGCNATEAPAIARVTSPYLGYELAICNVCGRYLKERRGPPTYELLVERALTVGLDEAAQQRGLRT